MSVTPAWHSRSMDTTTPTTAAPAPAIDRGAIR